MSLRGHAQLSTPPSRPRHVREGLGPTLRLPVMCWAASKQGSRDEGSHGPPRLRTSREACSSFLSEAPSGDATPSHAGSSGQLGVMRPLFPQHQSP